MNLALFDLDHTLLPLDSDHAWGQFTVELGWRDAAVFAKANDAFYEQYKAGTLDINTYVRLAHKACVTWVTMALSWPLLLTSSLWLKLLRRPYVLKPWRC